MKKIALLLFFVSSMVTISAQYKINGNVKDNKADAPLDLATIRLLAAKDSALVSGVRTSTNGKFSLSNIKSGNYILSITSIGFVPYTANVTVRDKDITLATITMGEDVKMLQQVDISGTAVQVMVRNDTIEYNAGSVKTSQNAVVEEVLKKLPGVEIDSEGKVTVNGQEIKKIRVDGKKFFGDDVQMATKNIPADMIDKIQVVDQKSDMAKLTGFEDDDTERIINLTTKKDRRQGIFGNVGAAGGVDINPDFRYDANAFLNIMNDDTRSTITGGANNINTSRSRRGRGGFGGGQNAGITATQNLGYNINTPLNDKMTIGGDVTYNHSENTQISDNNRDSYTSGKTYTNTSHNESGRNNHETNLRLEAEWKPDTLNTVIFQPNIGYSRYFSNSSSNYEYLVADTTTSFGESENNSDGYSINGGINVIYSHKFKSKKGRTLTANLNTSFSQSTSDGFNFSEKTTTDSLQTVDQRNHNNSTRNNVGFRISYVEPIWKSQHFLETVVSANRSASNSVRNLFDKDVATTKYTLLDTDYSNEFENTFYREAFELNYRYYQQNYNLMLGMKMEPSQTYSTTFYGDSPGISLENKVINFAPSAQFRYNFGKRQFARMDYRGRTNQPSISQMQPVKNNTDLMNETVGNAKLNPAFEHSLRLMYSTYSEKTFSSFNIGVMGNATKDDLTSNSIYDETGKRYIQTVNADKIPYSANFFTMFNTPIIQKKLQFNIRGNWGIRQQYGYTSKNVSLDNIDIDALIKGELSDTKRQNAGGQISLTYTHDIFDLGLRGGMSYSKTTNNLNSRNSETYNWSWSPNLVVRPTNALTLSTDLNFEALNGYSTFNQNQWLWNASLDWSILKKKGVLSLKVNDILHQRLNVTQTVGDNYVQYSSFNALQTYFLVGFSYKISKFSGSSSNPAENDMRNSRRDWRRDGRSGPEPDNGNSTPPPPPGE
ncbi:MAG: outer membrane beta-barrel protein [Paludibacteraceae bacterium]